MCTIYLVASYTGTFIGTLIRWRAKLKFWNRYEGDHYSHISLSLDKRLDSMMSFARRSINNPFNAGLIRENIRTGLYEKNWKSCEIAVMCIEVSESKFEKIQKLMKEFEQRSDCLKYNYRGLLHMLLIGKGWAEKNHYFCSQWVAEILKNAGVDCFVGKYPHNIRPFDFYTMLNEKIVYEGTITGYPYY